MMINGYHMIQWIILETGGGDIVMAVSRRFARLVRDATLGLRDDEVLELTGIGFATWRKMLKGIIPSDLTILQFAEGVGCDADTLLEEARQARPSTDPVKLIVRGLVLLGLSPQARQSIMASVRSYQEEEQGDMSNTETA
jgi:hypothetical protein